jgi:hypothetical protein
MMTQANTVEALLEEIDGVPKRSTNLDLWVPDRLTWSGEAVDADIAMAVVLDRLLAKDFLPAGFTQGIGGRRYHYRREISS